MNGPTHIDTSLIDLAPRPPLYYITSQMTLRRARREEDEGSAKSVMSHFPDKWRKLPSLLSLLPKFLPQALSLSLSPLPSSKSLLSPLIVRAAPSSATLSHLVLRGLITNELRRGLGPAKWKCTQLCPTLTCSNFVPCYIYITC